MGGGRSCSRLRLPRTRGEALKYRNCGILTGLVGLLFVIIAIVVPLNLSEQLHKELRDASLIDREDRLGWEVWSGASGDPIKTEVYVLDIVNPYEVMRGDRPVVHERGPYIYNYYKQVFNHSWNPDRTICRYRLHEYYVFQEEDSVGPDTDTFTTLNVVFQAMRANFGGTLESRAMLSLLYDQFVQMPMQDRVFQRMAVRDLLFGYRDPVLELASSLDPTISPMYPGIIGNSTWEKSMNESVWQEIYTGRGNIRNNRKLISINGERTWRVCRTPPCPPNPSRPIWATQEASLIEGGSDGSQFHPRVKRNDVLPYWDGIALRTVTLRRVRDTTIDGVACFRFQVENNWTAKADHNPKNAAYYHDLADGMYNLSAAAMDAPFFATRPRFDGVDPVVRDTVIGAWPSGMDTTGLSVDVEPISGASMQITGQTQLVMHISPLRGVPAGNTTVDWFPDVRESYPPLAWFRQSVRISKEDAQEFVRVVYGAQFVIDFVLYFCSTVGGLLCLWALWMAWWGRRQISRLPSKLTTVTETSHLFDDDGRSPRLDSSEELGGSRPGRKKEAIDLSPGSADLSIGLEGVPSQPGDQY